MRHHTNNPAQRATDIANREAKITGYETHDFSRYCERWIEVYHEAFAELRDKEEVLAANLEGIGQITLGRMS